MQCMCIPYLQTLLNKIIVCAALAVLFCDPVQHRVNAVGMGYNGYIAPAARVRRLDWLWSLCYRQFRHAPPLIRPPNTKLQVQSRTPSSLGVDVVSNAVVPRYQVAI